MSESTSTDGHRSFDTLRWTYVAACAAIGAWSVLAWLLAPGWADGSRTLGIAVAALLGVGLASARPRPRWVAGAVALIVWTVIAWGYVRWIADDAHAEMTGPFAGPNPFGALAAVAAVTALVLACTSRPWPLRTGAAVAAVVAGQALVRSGSMGALIALGCGAVVTVVATWPRRGVAGRRGAGVVVVAAVATGALALGLGVSALASSGTRHVAGTGLGVDPENHAAEHFEIWGDAVAVWRAHPVVGVGPGALPHVKRGLEDARDDVLHALAETGLVAALAWLLASACAGMAVGVVALRGSGRSSPATVALAAAAAVLVVYSVVDTTAAWPVVAAVFFSVAGSTVAAASRRPDPDLDVGT